MYSDKNKMRAYQRAYYHANPHFKERKLKVSFRNKIKQKFNLSIEDYHNLLEKQDFKCAICKTDKSNAKNKKSLCLDHDHKTGKVRGFLCHSCNRGLGSFKDSSEALTEAIKYLNEKKT